MPSRRHLADTGRVEAFSDGVLAIAITLLVLDLHTDLEPGRFADELAHSYFSYLAYVASFLNIGVIWVNHHAMFSRVRRVDPALLWLNLYLLASTSVLPFPTALLANALQNGTGSDRTVGTAVYALVSALMGSSWFLLYRHLSRHPDLLVDAEDTAAFGRAKARAVLGFTAYGLTAALGFASGIASAIVLFSLPVFYAFTSHSVVLAAGDDADRMIET